MDSPTSNLIQILRERVAKYASAGDYKEALHAAAAAVDKAQQALTTDFDSVDHFASALEIRGEVYRSIGKLEEAKDDFKQAIDQLDNRPDRLLQIARLYAELGAVHDDLGHPSRATDLWEKALHLFETADPPSPLDVAAMANNLASLRKANGDTDGAETYYLKALEILHQHLGPENEETATVSNNLGALYLGSGYHEQAREMLMMALEARRATFGDGHPDTAQSHNNLALALLQTGDRSWARRHFEKALEAYERLGNAYREDLEAVAENYCSFLREEGEDSSADRIEGKVRELAGA